MESSKLRSKKELVILMIIGVGLIAGIALVGSQQFLGSRASSQYIEVKSADNQPLPQRNNIPVAQSSTVKLELKPPQTP